MSRFAFGVVLLFLAVPAAGQDAKKDVETIQGTWDLVAFVINGRDRLEDKIEIQMTFKDDKMVLIFAQDKKEERHELTFKLDPTRKPKTIDVTALEGPYKGKTVGGIYQLDGDALKMCIPNEPGKDRPKEFASKEGSDVALFTLKRAKP